MSIATKFKIVVAVLAAILIGICGVVIPQVHAIRVDLRRVAEERREAEEARSLLLDIEGFARWVELRTSSPGASDPLALRDQDAHVQGALASLGRLRSVPADDPSRATHQDAEDAQYGNLRQELEQARAAVAAGSACGPEWGTRALAMRQLAANLLDEMTAEARAAGVDVDQRGATTMRVVGALSLVALVVLLAVGAFVMRGIVQPLRDLAAGTRAIGRGQRDHALPSRGGAEIADLSREITAMADELESHHRELRDRVEQRTRELVRSARLADLGAVAAGLAHEINNPLASIVACADGLQSRLQRRPPAIEEQREYLQTIAQEAERVREITTRLLEIARSNGDDLGAVDVGDAMRAVVTLLRHRFAQRGITLEIERDEDLPPVRSNAQELRQILLNLLGNALDASPPRGRVILRARRQGSEVVLDVDDQGDGVPADLVDKIFDPFFTTKRAGHGTGLGLAIVQRILERQGGHVEVGHLAPGARFRVRLPLIAA